MKITKKLLLYFIYIVAATVFFLYYLFPSDAAKKYVAFQLNKVNPDFSLTIDHIQPVLAPGIRFYTVSLYHLGDSLVDAEQITIIPGLQSLFRSKATVSFRGKAYEGTIEGKADITKKTSDREVAIDANFSGIRIEESPALQNLIDRSISGVLEGKVTLSRKGPSRKGSAKLTLSDCKVELLSPLINLDQLTFGSIKVDVSINKQTIQIKQCIFKGQQMDGRISGSVTLKKPFEKSVLNLSGVLKPHHFFLADLKKSLPANLFPKKRPGSSGYPIRLTGTLDKPGFALK